MIRYWVDHPTLDKQRTFATLEAAEKWARRKVQQDGGVAKITSRNKYHEFVAVIASVRQDALGRTWTDLCPAGAELL